MADDLEGWERDALLRRLDDYLAGGLTRAAQLLDQDHTSRLFAVFREELAGKAGEMHERKHGLLTPEALADQPRREALGRMAEAADAAFGFQLETNGANQPRTPQASPACMQGRHSFGQLRGPNGEAECQACGTIFIIPKG